MMKMQEDYALMPEVFFARKGVSQSYEYHFKLINNLFYSSLDTTVEND